MVKSRLRYYTYKVTFKDLPKYFYYGKHKDTGKPYFGRPKTWRHLWDQFEPEVQILQWYETEKEVKEAEDALIEHTWKQQWSGHRYSLNRNKGGLIDEEICRENGKKNLESMNKHPNSSEGRSKGGRTSMSLRNKDPRKPERDSRGGRANTLKQQEMRKRNAKKMNEQVWISEIDGFVSNAGGVAIHNKFKGWDPNARRPLAPEISTEG